MCHKHGHIAPESSKFQICQLCDQLGHTAPPCFQLKYNYIKNKDCPRSNKKISCGKELKINYKPNLNVNEKFQLSLERDLLIELHGFLKTNYQLEHESIIRYVIKNTIMANEILERYKLESILIIVHYDKCDLSSTFLHGVKLGPERSEGPNYAVQNAP